MTEPKTEPKRITISRRDDGILNVSYDGRLIENIEALSISISPMGVAATIVFTVDEVDVSTALHQLIGRQAGVDKSQEMVVN